MSDNAIDAAGEWAEALADGLIDTDGNLTPKGVIASRKMGAFPGSSPFYDQPQPTNIEGQLELGKHEFTPNEKKTKEEKAALPGRPIRHQGTPVVSLEDIYHRLDQALSLHDSGAENEAIQNLYELRDEIYRGLR